jgi:glycosyltransferase A (GT-A) superfamily protein (DUF2064 family)
LNSNTAILIFANSAQKDAELKSFLSKDVFFELNNQTLKAVEKTGIPYFHISENQQIGNCFGERFTNAIESIFSKGFKNVITIGNDTPHLKTKHLFAAFHQLEKNNDVVLGPSKDGGFYLMGIQKKHFCKEVFLNLPWQTNRLNSRIIAIAKTKKLQTFFLESLTDIDKKEDISTIIASFKHIPFAILTLLLHYLFQEKRVLFFNNRTYLQLFSSQNFNKGSPLACM